MATTKIKNRTQHAIILNSIDGDSVQINPLAITLVDSKFLTDFDRTKIQIFNTNPKPVITEIKTEVVSDLIVQESPKKKNSQK